MTLKTRKPTGAVPWPLVLLEGEEKAGKSWAMALLSASDKVGDTYWFDLGEGAADEYGAIPGARYEIVEHDGTWRNILEQIRDVRDLAQKAHDNGEKPVVLAIDSMSNEWAMLTDWAEQRARRSDRGKEMLRKNPDAEVPVSPNYWNDSNARHRKLMTILMTFPGIVVVTARGKEVAEMDKRGNPIPNAKGYRVEGQKGLAFDATVWVRMSRTTQPLIVGARSVHAGIKPGTDDPKPVDDFSLQWLIFDVLKCDPRAAHVRDIPPLDADAPDDTELDEDASVAVAQFLEDVALADTKERIAELWKEAGNAGWMEHRVNGRLIGEVLTEAVEGIKAATAKAAKP